MANSIRSMLHREGVLIHRDDVIEWMLWRADELTPDVKLFVEVVASTLSTLGLESELAAEIDRD